MKRVSLFFARLPIQWKLIIGSSLLICVLLLAYNAVQYLVIKGWLVQQEQTEINKTMNDIQSYYTGHKSTMNEKQIAADSSFIAQLNQRDQLIRIIDQQGKVILTVDNHLSIEHVSDLLAEQSGTLGMKRAADHLLLLRKPLITTQFTGTVEIVTSLADMDQISDLLLLIMLIGGVAALIMSGMGGILLTRQLLKPIQAITATMQIIKHKGLHERVTVINNHDELSKLAIMFNELMDALETSFQQQKQFVEDASHELRTPIAIIQGHLSLLQRWGKEDTALLNESLSTSLHELSRLNNLVKDLLELSQADVNSRDNTEVEASPEQVITELVKNEAMVHPQFQFHTELDHLHGVLIAVAPHHLQQILLIVLDNAIKYSLEIQSIQIIARIVDEVVEIQVVDQGTGIPKAELADVFNRFYRADKARTGGQQSGYGLGLSIAQRLVTSYQGTIELESYENLGTTATIRFRTKKAR